MIKLKFILIAFMGVIIFSCGENSPTGETSSSTSSSTEIPVSSDPMTNKGIGPITEVNLGEIDESMVAEGLKIYTEKCTACHNIGKRYIGPDLAGITKRRSPEWIMNMILNPEEMVSKDPLARQLLMEYSAPMANQSLTKEESRKILEYFRTLE